MGKDAKLKIVPEVDQAIREIAKLEQKYQKLEQRIADTGRKSATASRQAAGGHQAAAASLARYAAGFLTIGAGIRAATALIRDLRRELAEATQRTREQEMPLARLAQVTTAGRPLSMLIAEAQKTRLQTGMPIEQAAALQFTLESRGLGAERRWMAQLFPMAEPEAIAHAAGAVTAGFGREEAGTPRQVVNKLLTAARRSPLTAGQFAEVIGGVGPAFREIGGREEEALASVAAGARAAGGEQGATAMARLATFISGQERYTGKGFFGAVGEIEEETRGMSPAEFKKFMPELRARRGFGLFQANRELIMEIMSDVERAGAEAPGEDAISRMVREGGALPELFAPAAERRGKVRRERAAEIARPVAAEQISNAIADQIIAREEEAGEGYLSRLTTRAQIWATRVTTRKEREPRVLAEEYGLGADLVGKLETAVESGTREGTSPETLGRSLIGQANVEGDKK